MRVLAISSYGRLGGAELALRTFLGHRPTDAEVGAVVLGSGDLAALLAGDGIPVWHAAQYDGRPTGSELAGFARGLDRVLRAHRPDVVWAVGLKAAIMAAATCRRRRIPIVWHKVDFTLDRVLARPLAAVVDGVIAVSHAAAGVIDNRWLGGKLLGIVGPPVALPEATGSHPDPASPVIGTLGTLMPIKGHHHLLRAVALLKHEFPQVRVAIGGAETPAFPGYRQQLVALADRLQISERVELLGMTDPVALLERLTVYVSATYRERGYGFEGLSGAMLEASWTGVPVVATRGGGTPDGVLDGVTGTLVDPADPASLAEAIAAYLRDPVRARAAGDAGRAFARERFAPAGLANDLFTHLRALTPAAPR